MIPTGKVYGLLLCRAGGNRLAFPAQQVVAVEAFDPVLEAPHARLAFAQRADRGRTLIAESGEALIVDEVQVLQETVTLLPSPPIAGRGNAGWLRGFVSIQDTLWPVLELAAFSHFLTGVAAAEGLT